MCNTPTVNIGGKELSKGDIFCEGDEIVWVSELQAVKVIGEISQRMYLLSAREMKDSKLTSFSDYFNRKVRLSSRGGQELLSGDVSKKTVYLLDKLAVPLTGYEESGKYILSYRLFGKRCETVVPQTDDGEIVLDRELFEIEDDGSISVGIFFLPDNSEERIPFIENLKIIILPYELRNAAP